MMNQVVLVGRIKEFVKINENCRIKVAVQRSWKNMNGEYEIDIIPIICNGVMTNSVEENCKEEDVIGVKGRIQSNEDKIEIVAEKITLLSSRKAEK